MEDLGKNIAEYRKRQNMTQSELGQKLNISAQAVSKWEKGLSEPDIDTIKKMCEIFSCSINELTSMEASSSEAAATASGVKASESEYGAQTIIMGYCDICKKPLRKVNDYKVEKTTDGQIVICNTCSAKKTYEKSVAEQRTHESEFKVSMFWSVAAAIVTLVVLMIVGFKLNNIMLAILGGIVCAYAVFALVSQWIWDNAVCDCIEFFMRSFNMPGIIFSLDLDGIIWFICVKLTLSFLAITLSVVWFLIGLVISSVFAAFYFPFGLAEWLKEKRELKEKKENNFEIYQSLKNCN